MPYDIRKIDGKYCVVNKQTGRNTGCSDSLEMATKHLRALYAAESSYEGGNHDVRYQHSAIDSSVGATVGSYVHGPSDGLGLVMQDTNSSEPMIEIDRTQDGEPIMVPLSQVRVGPSKPVFAARSEDIQAVAQAFNVPANTTPTSIVAPRPNPQPTPVAIPTQVVSPSFPITPNPIVIPQQQQYVQADAFVPEEVPTFCSCPNCKVSDVEIVNSEINLEPIQSTEPTPLITWSTSERVLPAQDSFLQRIVDQGRSLMGVEPQTIERRPFELYKVRGILKGEDGVERTVEQLRFVAYWSNRYVDRSGSAIPLSAHERAIARIDESKAYPVLLQWHSIGTEYGQVDCMDISEGFNVAFGYILPGKEEIAYKIAEDKNVGMSHGSLYRTDRINGQVIDFYPFELTTLPIERAKNQWFTGIDIGQWVNGKEYEDMGFAPEKIAYLKSTGLTDEQINAAQQKTSEFKAKLAELGIEFKGDEPPDTASLMEAIGAMAESNKAMREELDALKAVPATAQTTTEPALTNADGSTGDVTAQNSDMQSLVDAAVAKALAGAQGGSLPFVASKSDDNVTGKVPVNNQANLTGWGERPAETFLKTALGNAVKLNGQS